MLLSLNILALVLPGYFRIGSLHLPVFGVVATAGLLAALALGDRTAKLTGLDPVRLWDAGVVAIVGAFVCSRLLLALTNPRVFARHPLLVLAQPSLSLGGLLLTAIVTGLWLRYKQLPLRNALDAWAAPAALLAAILQLGHFLEGTDAGMPTSLPWAIRAGDLGSARVHPVQLYAVAAYLALCALLYRTVSRQSGLMKRGQVAPLGLLAGGMLSFLLSFFRQPYDSLGNAWLDPAQYAALAAVAAGAGLWITSLRRPSRPPGSAPLLAAEGTLDAQ